MDRRRYLAVLSVAGLSGCLGDVGGAATPVVPDGVQRVVRLGSVDDAGSAHEIAIDATVSEPAVTDEHPARVRVVTKNGGRERDISVSEGQCCLFNRSGGASDPGGLWLHRTGASDYVERDGDRWSRDRPSDEPRVYPAYACLPKTYASGEAVTNEYYVWDDYREPGYLRPGTYRFHEPVTVREPGGTSARDADGTPSETATVTEFTWGFSLEVRRPDAGTENGI